MDTLHTPRFSVLSSISAVLEVTSFRDDNHNPGAGQLLPAATGALCICLALTRPAGNLVSFSLLMGTGFIFCCVYDSGAYAAIQDVVQPGLRATAMTIYFFALYLLGRSVGPVLTGKLSDHFARLAMTAAGASSVTDPFRAVGLHSAIRTRNGTAGLCGRFSVPAPQGHRLAPLFASQLDQPREHTVQSAAICQCLPTFAKVTVVLAEPA